MNEGANLNINLGVNTDKAEAQLKQFGAKASTLLSSGKSFSVLTAEQKKIEAMLRGAGPAAVNISKGSKSAWENLYGPIGNITNASASFRRMGAPPILADLQMKAQKDRSAFIKDMTFSMNPLFNPTSLWGHLFASRQIFGAFSQTKTGGNIMGKLGMSGVGGAALMSGGLIAGLTAIGLGMKALAKTFHEAIKAYEEAPKLYARSLMSGLSIGFVTKRSMLAGILGVSEVDVLKFGAALTYLNPKIEWASKIMTETNRNLTSVGWGFNIVGLDMKAMFATIANDAAPAMRRFADVLDQIIKTTTEFYNRIMGSPIGRALLFSQPAVVDFLSVAAKGKDSGAAPQPLSWMKQLPSSPWEHMGLVIGGGASSPANKTAHNTSRMVTQLEKLYAAIAPRSGGWNFSPAQSYQ